MNKMQKIFSERLREVMEERGLKQQQLADTIGYRQSIVCNWLNGKSFPMGASLYALGTRLGVNIDWLLGLVE